ncbi:Aste57867_14020 [Aphanomyces stellatus]|uniref:Aste57867_14020 protein n=1 Tax=Aphanomyces stellatus TaxID=120398 RepID=A0A485L1V5_9STRA|nr:hypothetical protein As57867_013969 [Aphanomyces stellatus]VFT90850.1 Aste57867_14020 [Aphanomyces stellatus]
MGGFEASGYHNVIRIIYPEGAFGAPIHQKNPGMTDAAGTEEYGLHGLVDLPLLEQVHRLLHAISMNYPYRETSAWKTLPLDGKRKILQYIKENKTKASGSVDGAWPTAPPRPPPDATQDDDYDNDDSGATKQEIFADDNADALDVDSALHVKQEKPITVQDAASDPYLAALLHREKTPSVGSPKYNMTWKFGADKKPVPKKPPVKKAVLHSCVCGKVHPAVTGDAVLAEIKVMMVTFGDTDPPCDGTATAIKNIVRKQIKATLDASSLQQFSLLDFTQLFPDEAMYYGRWKDFKSQTKDDDEPNEPDLSDDLVDELDMFASYESVELNAFQLYFLERMKFADQRTRSMDESTYLDFSKKRATNFMSHTKGFLDWLGLPRCSKACVEFLNFVVYNKIGRLVEEAIKNKHKGALAELPQPLMVADITATHESTAAPPTVKAKKRKEPSKPAAAPSPATTRLKRLR